MRKRRWKRRSCVKSSKRYVLDISVALAYIVEMLLVETEL